MKNRKGFTLIELIVCFLLITAVSLSLFKTVLAIQEKQAKNISYNSYISFVSVLNNSIENDFLSDSITGVSNCGTNCFDITYASNEDEPIRLEIDKTNNTITYGTLKEKLPNNYKFYKDISFKSQSSANTGINSYYLLILPIKNDMFPTLEDIKYIHEYNSSSLTNTFALNIDLDGGEVENFENNLWYIEGTTVNLPTPIKTGMIFKGWEKVSADNGTLDNTNNQYIMGDANASIKAIWEAAATEKEYSSNNCEGDGQIFEVSVSGYYKISLWGADGGDAYFSTQRLGGKGAYTEGIIELNKDDKLYVHVGCKGQEVDKYKPELVENSGNGYNGGAVATYYHIPNNYGLSGGGGGATDVRIGGNSLNDRIMVAAGGGGAQSTSSGLGTSNPGCDYCGAGGKGGDLVGGKGLNCSNLATSIGFGGTQTGGGTTSNSSYTQYNNSAFGVGGSKYTVFSKDSYSGGGGGYYGGGTGYQAPAGGGSSYISGYAGVNSISSSSLISTNSTLHHSNYFFINGKMEAGVGTENGYGHASIKYIGNVAPARTNSNLNNVRYIKDCISFYYSKNYNSWVEVQAIKNGENIAFGKAGAIYNSSNSQVNAASTAKAYSFVTDGLITNTTKESGYAQGISQSIGQCFKIDLTDLYDLDEVAVWHYWESELTFKNNRTFVSANGDTWTEIINLGEIKESSNGKRVNAWSN